MGNTWNRKKAMKIFKEFFPNYKGMIPFYRMNQYNTFGALDDAQIVDKLLWNKLIRSLIKESSDAYYEDPLIYLEGEITDCEKASDVIGKMWAVIIDYHS